jgi:hypothetical protein
VGREGDFSSFEGGFFGVVFWKKDGRIVITYTLSNCQKCDIRSSFCNTSTTNP